VTKFEVAISTLLIGYMFGQATDFVKYKWAINRKKKALEAEIDDIATDFFEKMNRVKEITEEINDSHIAVPVPGKINTVIFNEHYAEVAPFFDRVKRKSIYLIYLHAEHYNNEVASGNRSNAVYAKRSLLILYSQSSYGYESALFFRKHRGNKLFIDQKEKIKEINNEIQGFANAYNITN